MSASLALLVGGAAAGLLGSLLGLGGGIVLVPLLVLGLGRELREAVAVSLVCVAVTSSASAAILLERRVANLRLGLVLECFTAAGALAGGLVALLLPERAVAAAFAGLLAWVAGSMLRARRADADARSGPATGPAAAGGAAPGFEPGASAGGLVGLPAVGRGRLAAGAAGSALAGVVAALLGVGGGIVKVPVMHLVLGVPLRVAAATSNLMIGVTASVSALVYLAAGSLDPYLAGPLVLGVFAGASIGARIVHHVELRLLRAAFVAVLAWSALLMADRALTP